MRDARTSIVHWAQWIALENSRLKATTGRDACVYSEGSQRLSGLARRGVLPLVADCSGFIADMYEWAGAPTLLRGGNCYTGTLLEVGVRCRPDEVKPGDVVVYGPGTGWHTALIVEIVDNNILTISMGQQGDPSYVWVNGPRSPHDGRQPQTYLRFDTRTKKVYSPPKKAA